MTAELIFAFLTGYLLGSIPFGLLLTRIAGKGDVREVGSGNIGATNVLRAGGKALAAATLLLDALKATAAVVVARLLWPGSETVAAAGALVGHLYPLWLKFRGGKGVATYLGLLIPLFPIGAAIFALVWLGSLFATRISSLAGIAAVISAPVAAAIFDRDRLFPAMIAFTLVVIWRHHENIARLRAGTESKVGSKSG